jgi:RNA 3'-terminal phosphate cyclase (ATP)
LAFLEIDGSIGEGGGQILRTAVSLSAIYQRPVKIHNIRAGRKEPGLRPQHLQAILSAAMICNANTRGASVGSTSLEFIPGSIPDKFQRRIETGTAGSVTLIAQTIIPISIFRSTELDVEIVGGTEVPYSPTVDYLERIVVPIYRELGADVKIELGQRGYYPKGGGSITVRCHPPAKLPRELIFQSNKSKKIRILSVSRLLPNNVVERQLKSALEVLENGGVSAASIVTSIDDSGKAYSPGTSILIYSDQDCLIGASSLGEKGKSAERVGEEAANAFLKEIQCLPQVDSHLADMLPTLLSCLPGRSEYSTSDLTSHFHTNVQICEKFVEGSKIITSHKKSTTDGCFNVSISGV